jgi:hypothetical protein
MGQRQRRLEDRLGELTIVHQPRDSISHSENVSWGGGSQQNQLLVARAGKKSQMTLPVSLHLESLKFSMELCIGRG